ncbi:MAG: hypothetical protein DI552_00820 [Brevundimonas sp.]|nr:MAG: hypothetical protein DI552_00820 [Brevundimonas sp.]
MAESGPAGATARSVGARAGVSGSAINYHFGSIERLYGSAQAEAVRRASLWLDQRLNDVAAGEPWPFEAFPAFAADLIDSWSDAPVLAQAEASAFLQAAWEPSEAAAAWLRLWDAFWARALPRFSLDADHGSIVAAVLHSERLGHLVRWRRPHDRAGLEEVCARLVGRVTGDTALLARQTPWREGAEALSRQAVDFPVLAPAAARIAESVVAAVDEGGEAALTHRAVAAAAGVSLGAVTHHFPTRTALAEAGYAWLYDSIVQSARRAGVGQADHGDIGAHILSFRDIGRAAPRSRALEVFFLAATRDPALSNFAARVRYSRGLGTWGFLREQAPHLTRLDALLISHWTAGAGRAIAADPGLDDRVRAALLKANDIFAR